MNLAITVGAFAVLEGWRKSGEEVKGMPAIFPNGKHLCRHQVYGPFQLFTSIRPRLLQVPLWSRCTRAASSTRWASATTRSPSLS